MLVGEIKIILEVLISQVLSGLCCIIFLLGFFKSLLHFFIKDYLSSKLKIFLTALKLFSKNWFKFFKTAYWAVVREVLQTLISLRGQKLYLNKRDMLRGPGQWSLCKILHQKTRVRFSRTGVLVTNIFTLMHNFDDSIFLFELNLRSLNKLVLWYHKKMFDSRKILLLHTTKTITLETLESH